MKDKSYISIDPAAAPNRPRAVYVLVQEAVHLLDMGGPVQAIDAAIGFGADYQLSFVSAKDRLRSKQGIDFCNLAPLPVVGPEDWILIPGTDSMGLQELDVPTVWLNEAVASGARICSVCTGAFTLAIAGILDGRECTTHWGLVDQLREWSPTSTVHENKLFVTDGNVVTSAGVASGIDMALNLIALDHGPKLAAQVARELVVFIRRSGESAQKSAYLEHRAHIHPAIHRVQDYIIEHPDRRATIDDLATVAALSPRHLTRLFRETTGTTLKAFSQKIKLQVAQTLVDNPELSAEAIARRCGFQDGRQLRRLWREHFGSTLRDARIHARRRLAAEARFDD